MQGKNKQLVAIGKRIRALRTAHGYTQEGLAIRSGLDRAYFGGVERGERNVSAINLIRIAVVLGVEIGDLFPPIVELSKAKE